MGLRLRMKIKFQTEILPKFAIPQQFSYLAILTVKDCDIRGF
jgi:hypothetical protein